MPPPFASLALLALSLAAAPAGAATYQSRLDFTGTSLDCIKNHNLTGIAGYSHRGESNCHSLEASWRGPFYDAAWGAPICRQGPNDNTCGNWGYGCCMTCAFFGNAHGPVEFNLGKAFAPGTYLQTFTVEPQVPGAPDTIDVINSARIEIYFSQTGFGDTRGCARQGVFAPAILNTGDVWNVTVVIPDVGQASRRELAALAGPREGPVGGSIELAFKAVEKALVGGVEQETPIVGTPVGFAVSGPAGDAAFSANPATTEPDGVARTTITLGSAPGTYTVTATCAACGAKRSEVVDVQARQVTVSLEIDTDDLGGSRNGDRGLVGEVLPAFRVKLVSTGSGRTVDGVAIAFSTAIAPPDARGHTVAPSEVLTDSLGRAHAFPVFGSVAGQYAFRARCESCDGAKEVSITASAASIPIMLAQLPAKNAGKAYVSVAGPKNIVRLRKGCLPITLTPSAAPPNGVYTWSIPVSARDRIEFDGATSATEKFFVQTPYGSPQVRVCAKSASSGFNDIQVDVLYSVGTLVGDAVHRLTVQVAECVKRKFWRALRCADVDVDGDGDVDDEDVRKNPIPHGVLYGYDYVIGDANGKALNVPPGNLAAPLMIVHDVVTETNGTNEAFGPLFGQRLPPQPHLVRNNKGLFRAVSGQCLGVPYKPPDLFWQSLRTVVFDGQVLLRETVRYDIDAYSGQTEDVGTVTTLTESSIAECSKEPK